jgi:hypothetical protein
MLVMARLALPVLARVTVWAVLVEPIFCEPNVRLPGDKPTPGVGVGGGVVPPPPPQATHTPPRISMVANSRATGRRWVADVNSSRAKASAPASNQSNPAGGPKLGGVRRCPKGGVQLPPVVIMFSVLAAGDAPVGLTDAGEIVQVAPVGQPLTTLRLTVPVNPPTEVTFRVVVPVCPGAEILMGEGFADRPKSATVTATAAEVEPA